MSSRRLAPFPKAGRDREFGLSRDYRAGALLLAQDGYATPSSGGIVLPTHVAPVADANDGRGDFTSTGDGSHARVRCRSWIGYTHDRYDREPARVRGPRMAPTQDRQRFVVRSPPQVDAVPASADSTFAIACDSVSSPPPAAFATD